MSGIYPKKRKTAEIGVRTGILALAVFLLARTADAGDAVTRALSICINSVVPSLFPYMVVSSLIVSSGCAVWLGKKISAPFEHIFHLPGAGCAAVFLGFAAGFPVGARTACELYEEGMCTREEAQRLCALCNNTGPAFIIGGIGAGLFGDVRTGYALCALQLISALICAFLYAAGKRTARTTVHPEVSFKPDFTSAVTGAALSCLNVSAYIVFFSVLGTLVRSVTVGRAARLYPAVCALLEITSGAREAASIGGDSGFVLAAFAVGWGGLCVHAQSSAFMVKSGLDMKNYICRKLLHGFLCAALAALCIFCKNI